MVRAICALAVSVVLFSLLGLNGYAAKTEIVVGLVNSETGTEGSRGIEHRWGYQQAINDINARGGIFVKDLKKKLPMRLVVADDKSDMTQAAAAAEKLIKLEKADFIIGTTTTPLNVVAGGVAEKYKKLYVTPCLWPEEFLNQKFSWVVDIFFFAGDLFKSSVAPLEVLPKEKRPKKFAVMVPDDPDGQMFGGAASKVIPAQGYELAIYEPYMIGTKDFSPSILKMKKAGVEGMVILIAPTDGITLVRQMKEHDFNPKYVWGARGFWPVEFYKTLGADADYIVMDGFWGEAFGYGISKELGDRFRKDFNGATSVTVGLFYAVVQTLEKAIEEAGTIEGKKVRDVYYSGRFVVKNTTVGDLRFNEKGLAPIPPVALQWYKGERMPVYPPSPKIWTLKLIPPWKERK